MEMEMQVLPPAARLLGLVWFSQDLSSRLHTAAVRLDPCAGASDSTLSTSEAKISPQNLGEPWWKS
jgi:hypothetical protein